MGTSGWKILQSIKAGTIIECMETRSDKLELGQKYVYGGYFRTIEGSRCMAALDDILNATWNVHAESVVPEDRVTSEQARAAMDSIAKISCRDDDWNTMAAFIDQREADGEKHFSLINKYGILHRRYTVLSSIMVVTLSRVKSEVEDIEKILGRFGPPLKVADRIAEMVASLTASPTPGDEPLVPPELKHGEDAKDPKYGRGVFVELSGLSPEQMERAIKGEDEPAEETEESAEENDQQG
jgi:hypothetical protein